MATFDQIRQDKERIEREYDQLIAQLNAAQAELSGKASKVNTLGPGEYRLWLAKAKSLVQRVQADIAVKKVERSEARRAFNGWEASGDADLDGWLDEPDSEGWWWFHGTTFDEDDAEIEVTKPLDVTIDVASGALHIEYDDINNYRGKWKFLPMPDLS